MSWFLIKRRIKFIWQKWTRGFSDEEMWNLDITISKFILPRLKRHFEINKSVPYGVDEAEWEEIKKKMIIAFEYFAIPGKGIFGIDPDEENCEIARAYNLKKYEKQEKDINEGFELFAKFFHMLWY